MSTQITFHIPEDKNVLAALGELALCHEHLNYILRLTIKTLEEVSLNVSLDATKRVSSSKLREKILKVAKQRLGEGAALLELRNIVKDCKRVTNERNELIHSVWANESDGKANLRTGTTKSRPLPTKEAVSKLSSEIIGLYKKLNKSRKTGFLYEAFIEKKKA